MDTKNIILAVVIAVGFASCHKGQTLAKTTHISELNTIQVSEVDTVQTMTGIEFVLGLPVYWDAMFNGTNPMFVISAYPVDNIRFSLPPKDVQFHRTIPQNATVLGTYIKDRDKKVFIKQTEKIWKDSPGKYLHGFTETIDKENTKVWYILSDSSL